MKNSVCATTTCRTTPELRSACVVFITHAEILSITDHGPASSNSSSTPLGTLPSTSTAAAKPLSNDSTATNKRKVQDDDVVVEVDYESTQCQDTDRTVIKSNRYEKSYREAKEAYLKEQEKRLIVQGQLNEKDQVIHALKTKQADRDDAHTKALREASRAHNDALNISKDEARRMYQAVLKKEGKNVELHSKLTQRDKSINQLEMDNHDLKAKVSDHKRTIQQLQQKIRHLRTPLCQPTFVPHPDIKVRSRYNYLHPEAPRENLMYKHFEESRQYAPGTGKVQPSKYGSGPNWDLGLCHVTFETMAVCEDDTCEYRHHPLSINERTYMQLLEPDGANFLKRSTVCMRGKASRSV
jgi:hypothetical protein